MALVLQCIEDKPLLVQYLQINPACAYDQVDCKPLLVPPASTIDYPVHRSEIR